MEIKENVCFKSAAVLFGGIGGESVGLLRSQVEYEGKLYRFKLLCSIDYDSVACQNHDIITGSQSSRVMDLFTREQYIAWNGHEPPPEWAEVTPWDMWMAFGEEVPFFLFTSPPCKGLSGLLPEKSAKTDKYQALNELTVRGIELALQACLQYGDGLPAIIQLENVPRIQTRGKKLLNQIVALLKRYGYAVSMRADHNLGEIGGLGQSRVRFLILARLQKAIPNFIYYPKKKKLKSIGAIIGDLPLPGDTECGGPLHKVQRLQWKTWKRLALIPPGGDWRDLNKVDWRNLCIVSISGDKGWPISDLQLQIGSEGKTNILRIQSTEEPAACLTGAAGPYQGATCIADPKVKTKLHPDSYGVQDWEMVAKTVRAASRIMQSAGSISDPRISDRPGRYTDKFRIQKINEPAATITGVTDVQSGAQLIADPKLDCAPRADSFGVQDWNQHAKTVIGSSDIHAAAAAVADPRVPEISNPCIPEDDERGVWIIIAPDGTWHRPFTTFENAMLQSFPRYLPDGRPFQLFGCNDAKAREYIGNAVPPEAAEEMGNVILLAAAQAEANDIFSLSWEEVWVKPLEGEVQREAILIQ